MTGPAVTYLSARTFPRTELIISDALRTLHAPGGAWVCRHVMAGAVAAVCADHPRLGLMCRECAGIHDQRHDAEAKHRCDACGEQTERMHDTTCTVRVSLKVRVPRGQRGRYTGPVVVVALGACPACLAAFLEQAEQ